MKDVEPLSQEDLGRGGDQCVVQGFDERRLVAAVTPGSATRAQYPSVGVLHVHLFMMVSSLGKVDTTERTSGV